MILREVSDRNFVAPDYLAAVDWKLFVAVVDESRSVANQRSQQRRFAGAVAAHERDFFAASDAGGEARNDFEIVV